jgi:hypothetical protein
MENLTSIVNWVSVETKLPKLEKKVLIFTKDGNVDWGMISERITYERNEKTRFYEKTGTKHMEWGQEENCFENWVTIKNVIYWAEFPILTL